MASKEIIQTRPQMALAKPSTPPSGPNQSPCEQLVPGAPCENAYPQAPTQPLTFQDLEQLILKLVDAKSKPPKSFEGATPDAYPEVARASKLEYKTVIEIYTSNSALSNTANTLLRWDEEEEEYKIQESPERMVKIFDEYLFVIRIRIGK
jgi:hypothetical protein